MNMVRPRERPGAKRGGRGAVPEPPESAGGGVKMGRQVPALKNNLLAA